jgi:hypothetical protein
MDRSAESAARGEPATEPTALTKSDVAFPLKASQNARYLVDQNGRPFRIQGDAAWSYIANLSLAEMDTYLADRVGRGFSAILANLIEHKFAVRAPQNRRGDFPFTSHNEGAYDFSTPNEAYFAYADAALDKAEQAGLLVLLDVMFLGYQGSDHGWWTELVNNTNTREKCYAYGKFIGARYKQRTNVMWIFGGDYTPPGGSEGEARLLEIYRGVRDAGATQLVSAHIFDKLSTDWTHFAPFIQANALYASGPDIYKAGRTAIERSPALPAFLLESGYEAEGWSPGDPATIRAGLWWAQLSSVGGVFFGHRDIWAFQTDTWSTPYKFGSQRWQLSLDTEGSRTVRHMASLLRTLPWYDLLPSEQAGMKRLVVNGEGTMGGGEYVVSAATADGRALLAYLPPAGSWSRRIEIDMSALKGKVSAAWWDPTNGASTPIPGDLPTGGPHSFTSPGNNSAKGHDWLLVLRGQ